MIDEKKQRPIVVTMAARLCLADGRYRWRYLRKEALDRIKQGADDRDEYVVAYHRFLYMARAAVKLMEEVK